MPGHSPEPSPGFAGASAMTSALAEKNASSSAPTPAPAPAPRTTKPRTCTACRSRKIRCDRLSPCSNCRRANVVCAVPADNRRPRWARRFDRVADDAVAAPGGDGSRAGQVMDRLRNLEDLVRELSGPSNQANVAPDLAGGGSSDTGSSHSASHKRDTLQSRFGRLVLHDTDRSRYISSSFWSRVSDELDDLKLDALDLASSDYDSSDQDYEDNTVAPDGWKRTPGERHAFLFRPSLASSESDIRELRPLPSQVSFLLTVFSENVNWWVQIVHMPTVTNMVREASRSASSSSPANEALMFSIYYAAITSMEEDDVVLNFGRTKKELNVKFRLGLEHALVQADFLNTPNIMLVQAFAIFLLLVRRHDSPKFVWMMTGLVIRMAHSLGLQQDSSHFPHLTPFEMEMRRRVWWALCMLDLRTSEDQGTDFTIKCNDFDTKLPMNINDGDIGPDTKEWPLERQGITDMSLAHITFEMCDITRQMMALNSTDSETALGEQNRLLKVLCDKAERDYLQHTKPGNIADWVAATVFRLVVSKLTLIIHLPALFSKRDHFSDDIRNKLLVAAIEIAEYNHSLNAEEDARHWRWIYQTYTHWHSIIYLLLEICRRRWSITIERAWIALHSSWLIPAQPRLKDSGLWVPLRKLMAKSQRHRQTELDRIRGDESLSLYERNMPKPGSSGQFPVQLLLEHWRKLVTVTEPRSQTQHPGSLGMYTSHKSSKARKTNTPEQSSGLVPSGGSNRTSHEAGRNQVGKASQVQFHEQSSVSAGALHHAMAAENTDISVHEAHPTISEGLPMSQSMGTGFGSWLWADTDPSVDVFADVDINMEEDVNVDWNRWIESATGMELDRTQD